MAIRVLIADDDALIREGLKIVLGADPEFEVTATAENGFDAVQACLSMDIDVALLDIRMPVMNGVEAAKQISLKTNAKPLILTTFDDEEFVLEAIKNGAKGYLLKNTPTGRLKDSIRIVHSGGTVMQDQILDTVKNELSRGSAGRIDRSLFSDREVEIIELIAQGLSNKGIAQRLFISEGTVKNYVSSILGKTGLEHRTQIAIYYLKGEA
jgi:DNA-binding NarL/FixJ family response regulator